MKAAMPGAPELSVVIPVYNEEESVLPLYEELLSSLQATGKSYEIIFVDDGSTDATLERLKSLSGAHVLSFARNHGKSKALEIGFAAPADSLCTAGVAADV